MTPHMSPRPLPEPVGIARARRAELLAAASALERALAIPARDPTWQDRVKVGIESLRTAFDHHVTATEGPDGMYADIMSTAPRLKFALDQLVVEHADMRTAMGALAKLAAELDPADVAAIDRIRVEGTDLLARLVRHRQRGADMVYEAYEQDIGGGS